MGACLLKARREDDAWHRSANEAAAVTDRLGYALLAVAFPALVTVKTWLREGRPGVALLASTHALLAAAYFVLIGRKGSRGRQFYVAHREALVLLGCLSMQFTVRLTALHGGVNTIDHHSDSAASLLLLLLGHTTALYSCIYLLYARLLWPASLLVPAVMAVNSLVNAPRMCRRVLESPGVARPLAELHSWIGLAHGTVLPPHVSELLTNQVSDPMSQCLAASSWMAVVVGAALPAILLWQLERRGRRWFERQQRATAGALAADALAAGGGGGKGWEEEQEEQEQEEEQAPGVLPRGPVVQLALCSIICWVVTCSLL